MAKDIAILGQVVGTAKSLLRLVDGKGAELTLAPTPEQLLIQAATPEAQRKVVAVLDHLAGDGTLDAALDAHVETEDEKELADWIRLYRAIKADFADNGQLDDMGSHLADIAQLLHVKDQAVGWAGNVFSRIKGLLGGKK